MSGFNLIIIIYIYFIKNKVIIVRPDLNNFEVLDKITYEENKLVPFNYNKVQLYIFYKNIVG